MISARIRAAIQQGHALLRQDRPVEALHLAKQVLAESPDEVEALYLQALCFLRGGGFENAALALRRAIAQQPGAAALHLNLGVAMQALGRLAEAEAAYREAIRLQPGLVEAHWQLASACERQGRFAEAEAASRRALKLDPQSCQAWHNLGIALLRQGRGEEAVPALRKALRFCPGLVWSQCSLAAALRELGRIDDALAEAEAASRSRPDLALPWLTLAETRLFAGQHDAALNAVLTALAIDPAHAEAYRLLTESLRGQGFTAQSLLDCGRALAEKLASQPMPEAKRQARLRDYHLNLAGLFVDWGQHGEAELHYRAALAIDPECDEARGGLLFAANYRPEIDPLAARREAERQGEALARRRPQGDFHAHDRNPERPLRIGLVSGDFGRHPVGYLLAGPLACIDRDRFQLHAYSTHARNDRQTEVLRAAIPHWRDVDTFDDDALIEQIRADGIDILIDLSGHTRHNRLAVFAARAAPVQVSWLGYFATTGLSTMDWILADPQVLPPAEEAHFCERPWRLPDSYYCFAPPADAIEVAPLPSSLGAPFTFGCFNNPAKLNDGVIALWARILTELPTARLFLKYRDYSNPNFVAAVRARFAAHGIDAARLEFEADTLRPDYLRAFNRVDVALDPFPYPGGATTVDGLWMGVPALTLRGDRFIAHQGETILKSAGLSEWIARDADEYVARAIAAAGDIEHLAALRARLRTQLVTSPLCDAGRFARNLEAAWRGMWRQWCEPAHEG